MEELVEEWKRPGIIRLISSHFLGDPTIEPGAPFSASLGDSCLRERESLRLPSEGRKEERKKEGRQARGERRREGEQETEKNR